MITKVLQIGSRPLTMLPKVLKQLLVLLWACSAPRPEMEQLHTHSFKVYLDSAAAGLTRLSANADTLNPTTLGTQRPFGSLENLTMMKMVC